MDLERYKEQERRRLDSLLRDSGASPEERRASIQKLRLRQNEYMHDRYNALLTGPAEFWIESERMERYERRQLLGDLWAEGEIAVLGGRSGIGKSIFAVHLATALAAGQSFGPYPAAEPRRVLYVDLDSSPELFARRYSRNVDGRPAPYEFPEGFLRSVFEWDTPLPPGYESMESLIFDSIIESAANNNCRTIIIDSLPQIAAHGKQRNLIDFLLRFKWLRDSGKASILLIAETTSVGRTPDAVSHDIAGPGIVKSVADSIFTLSPRRRSPHVRYLKHVKSSASTAAESRGIELFEIRGRSSVQDGAEIVPHGQLPPADSFPEFHHIGHSTEELRYYPSMINDADLGRRVRHLAANGLTPRLIALVLEVTPIAVASYLRTAADPELRPRSLGYIDITAEPKPPPE